MLADRNPFYVRLSNGDIRNGYTLKILNKRHEPRTFTLRLSGLPDSRLNVVGNKGSGEPRVTVPTDVLSEFRVFVAVPGKTAETFPKKGQRFTFSVHDVNSDNVADRTTTFRRP